MKVSLNKLTISWLLKGLSINDPIMPQVVENICDDEALYFQLSTYIERGNPEEISKLYWKVQEKTKIENRAKDVIKKIQEVLNEYNAAIALDSINRLVIQIQKEEFAIETKIKGCLEGNSDFYLEK